MVEFLGFLACIGPLLGIIFFLMWATRRPKCPQCQHAVTAEDAVCPQCGHVLQTEGAGKKPHHP